MDTLHEMMRAKWRALWAELGAVGDGDKVFDEIAACYGGKGRHYHTLQHVAECLAALDRFPVADQPADDGEVLSREWHNTIAWSLWMHDVIYNPKRNDNEVESAKYADRVAKRAGLSWGFKNRVWLLVMATRHKGEPSTVYEAVIRDCDLAGLGAEKDRFDEISRQVREEYAHVPTTQYCKGRIAIFQPWLTAAYYTERFLSDTAHVRRTRENLSNEVQRLQTILTHPSQG